MSQSAADLLSADHATRLIKTEAGRRALHERALGLSRPARNLLFVIEPSRPAAEWVAAVHGCSEAELRALLAAGLIAVARSQASGTPGQASQASPPDEALVQAGPTTLSVPSRLLLAEALECLGYSVLYERITSEAKRQLGLLEGYRLILDLERCPDAHAVRVLAQSFVEKTMLKRGEEAAQALAERLAAPERRLR